MARRVSLRKRQIWFGAGGTVALARVDQVRSHDSDPFRRGGRGPLPTPEPDRAEVVGFRPSFEGYGQASPPPSPFSVRKVVQATPLTDPGARRTGLEHPAPSSRPEAIPTDTGEAAAGESGLESGAVTVSADERQTALSKGLRWNMVGRPVIEAASLVGAAVLARLVAPAEFGRFAIALIVLLLASVPTQTVQYTIVQRSQIDRDHLKTGVTLTILMALGVCGFCLAASYSVVPMLFGARTAVLVRLMIPACLINSVNTVQLAIITRRLEFRRLSLLDMTITLVGTAVSIALAAIGLNGEAMVLGVVAGSTAGYVLTWWWVRPPVPNLRVRAARDLLRSGIPAASGAASLVGFQNCDYVIVGARLGALQAGYYFRAYTLGVVYQTKVSQVLNALGFPVLSRVTNEDEIDRLRHRMIHTITLILFPLLAVLAIVAGRFVTWLYGPAWQPAVVPVQILTVGGGAMLIAQAVTVAMLATGRARAVMWWGWGHFLAYGAAVFAVARLGLPAIAIAAVVVHTTFLVISYVQLEHGSARRALRTLATDVFPAAACCIGLAAAALPVSLVASKLDIPTVPYLCIIGLASGVGYILSLRLWFPEALRYLGVLAGRLLPVRAHRLVGRLVIRPQPQSAP